MKKELINDLIWSIGILLFGLIIFSCIYYLEIQGDIKSHLEILVKTLKIDSFPVPPLYYFSVYSISGFSKEINVLSKVAIGLLSISVMVKFLVTKEFLNKLAGIKLDQNLNYILAFSLLIIMPVISGIRLYLGELPPNVWHNSTIIYLFPFALLLFSSIIQFTSNKISIKKSLFLFILVLINVLIKPSYVFVFSCLPIAYFFYFGIDKKLYIFIGLVIFGGILIFLETNYLFFQNTDPYSFESENKKNGIEIDFLYMWQYYSKNLTLSFFTSILFPLSVLLLYPKRLKSSFALGFSWLTFITALLIFCIFTESGYRKNHGNFLWSIIPSIYLLFMVSVSEFLSELKVKNNFLTIKNLFLTKNWRINILLFIFILHLISGIGYIFKLIYFKSYV